MSRTLPFGPAPTWPPPLRPGSRVGVVALSGVVDPVKLARGQARLLSWGFEPVSAENLQLQHGSFAGTDEERLRGFHALLEDDSIEAIWFARGGHGLLRVLPRVNWQLLARRPRAFLGYSDLTPLLLEMVRRFGWVTFHAPMVAADLARELLPEEELSLRAALAGDREALAWPVNPAWECDPSDSEIELGPIEGGCLSLLVATLGTPFAWRARGQLFWFEDVREPFYRIDRMLTQLDLSGRLRQVSGVVVGHLYNEEEADLVQSVIKRLLELLPGRPVWSGFPAGHRAPNLVVPLGWPVRYVPARRRLELVAF